MSTSNLSKLTLAGMFVTIGIIFGDIGTSPLYVFASILKVGGGATKELVYGGISCVFWTLTLQTTFKYIIITLTADNKGEGGIFSLYALVKRYGKKLFWPAIIGAGTLLADGIITPPISISSAIEGLAEVKGLEHIFIPGSNVVIGTVIGIILALFFFQRFGTKVVGIAFSPIMLLWFVMLSVLGISQISQFPAIFEALNPVYGIKLLLLHPSGFWLLGSVFLATTGAEALYSDLGHCGKKNIQASWIFVKIALVLNYLGQGAYVMQGLNGGMTQFTNPFFAIVPHWFLLPSIIIATCATIIASQALISGSFTLISEAISMNFWPKVTIKYPTDIRGQIYIPSVNWLLAFGCILVTLYFKTSEHMTVAYGFSITIAMLTTTTLIYYFLRYVKHWPLWVISVIMVVFISVEFSFFVANAIKIVNRLFFVLFEVGLIFVMYIWYNGRKINNRFLNFVDLNERIPLLEDLSNDLSVPKMATHLVYLTKANNWHHIEERILHSIFSRNTKRADIYWFIHIEKTDEPYTMEYSVEEIKSGKVMRIEFRLGFKIQPRINVFFRKVVEEMVAKKEIDIKSRYPSLHKHNFVGDFKFVILEKFLSYDNSFTTRDKFIINSYFRIRRWGLRDERAYGLDTSDVKVERIPIVVAPTTNCALNRIAPPHHLS